MKTTVDSPPPVMKLRDIYKESIAVVSDNRYKIYRKRRRVQDLQFVKRYVLSFISSEK